MKKYLENLKMSKIEELIKQYCPDGVEFKTRGELGEFYGGLTGKKKDDFKDASFTIVGTDPETVIDTRIDYESELDAPMEEEDIYVNKKGTE